MKLEVGMYVRTDKGFIAKIKEFEYHYTKGNRLVDGCGVKEVIENYLLLDGNQCGFIENIDYSIPPCYPSDEELDKIKRHIVKTSHNIIDLIEVGDYVNGYYVEDVLKTFVNVAVGSNYFQSPTIYEKDIKSIVTKEMYQKMEYRIGE